MRKLYTFLAVLMTLGLISSGVVRAQTYAMTDYLVRCVPGSGSSYQEITGTHITNLEASNYQNYYMMSGSIQLPFNVRFLNLQLTTTNTFQVNGCGNIVLSQTWPSGSYDYEAYYNYGYCSNRTTQQGYDYPYEFWNGEQNYGSYGYYANYQIAPFSNYQYSYPPQVLGDYEWTVLGSAPNRSLVVQTKNCYANYYYYSPTKKGNWQAVIYEAGISNFQFNYGHEDGSFYGTYGYAWGETYDGGSYSYGYGSYSGIKAAAGQNLLIGWFGSTTGGINDANYGMNVDGTGTNPKFAYNHYGGGAQYYIDNNGQRQVDNGGYWLCNGLKHLPTTSYRIFIAWSYDLTAGLINIPINQQPYSINQPFNPTVTIINSGRLVPTSAQVNFTIYRVNAGQVYNQTVTIPGSALPQPFTSATYDLTNYGAPAFTPANYGIYEDTAIIFNLQPTADQSSGDNSMTNEWICAPPNDIMAVTVLNPPTSPNRTPIAVNTPVQMRFRNLGTNNQTNVPVTAVIRDPSGTVVYRDTVYIPNWPSGPLGGNSDGVTSYAASGQGPGKGAYYDTTFKDWIPAVNGLHKVCGIAIMTTDQLRGDDTICGGTLVRFPYDAAANSVVIPQPDQEMPYKTSWQPAALFQSVGVSDLFDVPVRVQIKRCSDGAIVFQADSTMPELNIDQNLVRFYFPSDAGPYHISAIPPGCYTICAIARYQTDGDRTNDTACSQFSIIDQLKGDIYVGVGQRFQTIHAAVDSMRFRGVGGNLRLIMTDNNYTEDGTSRISSPNSALDFRGIRGLSPTSTVTWIPKAGVHPTITFTGSKASCMYFGDLFGGYMTFEGYNPLGVPIPDKLTAEPNKRGLTIVDNRTVAGPVFDIEQGASNITLKDLVIHGNSMYANDSSQLIRIWNEQNRTIYLQFVRDTVPINHVAVNNCELGAAKYGILDHGLVDQFNIGQSKFVVWRNNSNSFVRNTIGSTNYPLSYAGIQFNNEQDLTIAHNEISNISTSMAGIPGIGWNAYGILQPNPTTTSDTGNVVRVWVDANRIHNVAAINGNSYGVAFQQAVTIYVVGSGPNAIRSQPPIITANRVTNNMIYDLRTRTSSYPLVMMTAGASYSTERDSVFNNSISTANAAANITVQYSKHPFLWNNILQNTSAGPYTNYVLTVPRPFASNISSDYNLFDLRGTNTFATVNEYDVRYGTQIQTRTFRRLNDWRTYVAQDMHSLTGDPMFASDSLHMPSALTYIESPASNNGAWLGTATQARDFDGDLRLMGNQTPDIGADEWDGFQFTNDLAVMSINQPQGFSSTSDTSLVTTENPLWINATVKNLSSQALFNRTVNAKVEVAISGGAWTTIYNSNSSAMTWDVNESKNMAFQGPTLTQNQVQNGVFRVTVSVPSDQNNANNVQQKVFRVMLKQNATLISYDGSSAFGRMNKDSVAFALRRLGVPYDSLDRNSPNGLAATTDIDYRPWWTLVWSSGDPTVAPTSGQPVGHGGLTLKETTELERYLSQGLAYAKKNLVIAGQNIAYYNGYLMLNNAVTDTEFTQGYMHTAFVANSPVLGTYSGTLIGQQPAYWKFPDNIVSASPDVIKPSFATPLVGPEVTGFAYSYATHPLTASDSGAGTTYYNNLVNTVFYGFDWADPIQTSPSTSAQDNLTSGTTRTLAAAFAFFTSHAGTILPVEFVSTNGERHGSNASLTWEVSGQQDVAQYDVEQQRAGTWTSVGHVPAVQNSTTYGYTDGGLDATQSYSYRIAAVDKSGAKTYSNTIEVGPDMSAAGYSLANYPNPTTGATEVTFTLPAASDVTIRVLDVTGKVVWNGVSNESMSAGAQSVRMDLSNLASGTYVYELVAVGQNGQATTISKKLTLNRQ